MHRRASGAMPHHRERHICSEKALELRVRRVHLGLRGGVGASSNDAPRRVQRRSRDAADDGENVASSPNERAERRRLVEAVALPDEGLHRRLDDFAELAGYRVAGHAWIVVESAPSEQEAPCTVIP